VAVTWSLKREPPSKDLPEFPRLIQAWFDEVRDFNSQDVQPFKFTKKLGHYTQVDKAFLFTYLCTTFV